MNGFQSGHICYLRRSQQIERGHQFVDVCYSIKLILITTEQQQAAPLELQRINSLVPLTVEATHWLQHMNEKDDQLLIQQGISVIFYYVDTHQTILYSRHKDWLDGRREVSEPEEERGCWGLYRDAWL